MVGSHGDVGLAKCTPYHQHSACVKAKAARTMWTMVMMRKTFMGVLVKKQRSFKLIVRTELQTRVNTSCIAFIQSPCGSLSIRSKD